MAQEAQGETAASSATEVLEQMTAEERKSWQETGNVPVRPKEAPATSAAPASEAKSEPEKQPAETQPESEPGKVAQETEGDKVLDPLSRGDRRILQLLAERKALRAEIEGLRHPKAEVKAEPKPESAPGKPSTPVVIPEALKAKSQHLSAKLTSLRLTRTWFRLSRSKSCKQWVQNW